MATSRSTKPRTIKVTEITKKSIPFTAFQALWIPGTTRICTLGSNDGGFGVIQVHALSSTTLSTAAKAKAPVSDSAPTTSRSSPKLIQQSETEKKVQFKSGTFRSSARSSSLPHLLTGDFDGRVALWDLARTEFPMSTFRAHEDVVNCMDGVGAQSGRPEFVTGSRDGTVRLWDTRQNHKEAAKAGNGGTAVPISNMAPRNGLGRHDIWCVALGGAGTGTDDSLMVVVGYENGDVRAMDLRMGKAVFETNVKHGVCGVEFDKREGNARKLVATTLEGTMHSFDLMNGQFAEGVTEEVVAVQSGDDSTLWQIRHIPQQPEILAVTDGGGAIYMYEHGDERSLINSMGSQKIANQGILSLEFNDDLEGLFVGCDLDNTLRVGMVHL
ncbi:hypothetical protein BGZ51_004279 [Haplosporangium sp. Z 767]|nr:hypothetical protein BGZ51_004279 [Haplosporangium sp. Z 767]KAF9196592.1 hypothetical protein BGZ50_009107 [Haplosporangium sp. Z 11]